MKIEFTGRHIEVTPALKAHVKEHFSRIDHLFEGTPAKAHVVIEVERGRHRSEIIITFKNETLTAESKNSDMYVSLAQTISKIEKQARKLKDKVVDKRKSKPKAAVIAPSADSGSAEVTTERHIIEMNGVSKKPMAPEEALLHLNDKGRQFVVFRNSENAGKTAVIFKREDGHFGLIQA